MDEVYYTDNQFLMSYQKVKRKKNILLVKNKKLTFFFIIKKINVLNEIKKLRICLILSIFLCI